MPPFAIVPSTARMTFLFSSDHEGLPSRACCCSHFVDAQSGFVWNPAPAGILRCFPLLRFCR